jgi:aspartate aminotransferase-like enzyme
VVEHRVYLQAPGPTNIPQRILKALDQRNMASRGPEFTALAQEVLEGLKDIFETDNEVVVLPGSGSGAMEAAIVNTLSPGEAVLALRSGHFANRFGEIAQAHDMKVDTVDFEWGEPVSPEAVRQVLAEDDQHRYKAILLTHNETSTGVTNDVEAISQVRRELDHPALLLVDAVSSLGCIELPFDDWELDVVATGSQKGLMLPPGLAILALSDRAWQATEESKTSRWYWDLRRVEPLLGSGLFPYTPPQPLIFALREALTMFKEEGLENVFARHERLARGVRAGVRALGLEVLAGEEHASNSVTTVLLPEGIAYEELAARMRSHYGVVLGDGLGELSDRAFRIGHLGALHETDIFAVLGALEAALFELGMECSEGAAVAAAARAVR